MIYDLVDLSDWKKKKEILIELQLKGYPLGEREFRKRVEINNQLYAEHLANYFIAHSTKGYLATNDSELIKASLNDNKKRAMTQLKIIKDTYKALGENINFSLEMENI